MWQCQEPREPHKGQLPPEHQEADVVPDCLAMEGVGLYGRPLCVKTPPSVVDPHVSEPIGCVMILKSQKQGGAPWSLAVL